jgi:hypothetical protein
MRVKRRSKPRWGELLLSCKIQTTFCWDKSYNLHAHADFTKYSWVLRCCNQAFFISFFVTSGATINVWGDVHGNKIKRIALQSSLQVRKKLPTLPLLLKLIHHEVPVGMCRSKLTGWTRKSSKSSFTSASCRVNPNHLMLGDLRARSVLTK